MGFLIGMISSLPSTGSTSFLKLALSLPRQGRACIERCWLHRTSTTESGSF